VPEFRYPQFCAIARAAEIVGERWTILIVRELFFGQQRFSDLRRRLSDVSPSVLAERLATLEQRGLVRKLELAPPAASVVYELTESGRGLGPVLMALAQWGSQFLLPLRPGEQLDADRVRFGLGFYARKGATPEIAIELRVRDSERVHRLVARGGGAGTTLSDVAAEEAALVLEGEPLDLVAVVLDAPEGRDAVKRSRVKVLAGPRAAARIREVVALLFDFESAVGETA
jgi:DNA-binding HxlR family transcriptional regulator